MKKESLKVGIDGFAVSIDVDMPENMADVKTAAKDNAEYIVSKFVRGYRIDLQEGGARQIVREMVEAAKRPASVLSKDEAFVAKVRQAVIEEIGQFDPNAPRSRGGRPARPITLTAGDMATIAAAKNQTEAMAAFLASKGIKLEIAKG